MALLVFFHHKVLNGSAVLNSQTVATATAVSQVFEIKFHS